MLALLVDETRIFATRARGVYIICGPSSKLPTACTCSEILLYIADVICLLIVTSGHIVSLHVTTVNQANDTLVYVYVPLY